MTDALWNTALAVETEQETTPPSLTVETPTAARDALYGRFQSRIVHNPSLDRTLVSFQASKQTPFYGWFKYREGFSRQLVHYLLEQIGPRPGVLLDPFAGSGSALFAASEKGWTARGVEVLPVGVYAMNARVVAERIDVETFAQTVAQVLGVAFAEHYDAQYAFHHIAITQGAYPEVEEQQLIGYIAYCNRHIADADIRALLLYASFCILEDISYTRKDGQYLRWDARSGRSQGKRPFDKGRIWTFREAIETKLRQMVSDLAGPLEQSSLFSNGTVRQLRTGPPLEVLSGSCLELLPTMARSSVDFVLTSPPYANRYDYTRTYALELVYLGCDHEEVKRLRQTMLSCTVENKDKRAQLEGYYTQIGRTDDFTRIDETFNRQAALQEVLSILDAYRDVGALNNAHINRLVRNYFYEMSFVVHELARVLRPGGVVAMVNDNVRYAGEEVPVDLILSDFAETFGLSARTIWTLGRGKGNSSQQMGSHGRTELRKCVYVWEKQ
jgi:hypothetical protein